MDHSMCPVCKSDPMITGAAACEGCIARLGLRAFPPSQRPQVPCARCEGRVFVRVVPREFSGGDSRMAAPMWATVPPALQANLFSDGYTALTPRGDVGFGAMEMVICRGCGFTEWYCQDPASIPIGSAYNTVLAEVDGAAPYR